MIPTKQRVQLTELPRERPLGPIGARLSILINLPMTPMKAFRLMAVLRHISFASTLKRGVPLASVREKWEFKASQMGRK